MISLTSFILKPRLQWWRLKRLIAENYHPSIHQQKHKAPTWQSQGVNQRLSCWNVKCNLQCSSTSGEWGIDLSLFGAEGSKQPQAHWGVLLYTACQDNSEVDESEVTSGRPKAICCWGTTNQNTPFTAACLPFYLNESSTVKITLTSFCETFIQCTALCTFTYCHLVWRKINIPTSQFFFFKFCAQFLHFW